MLRVLFSAGNIFLSLILGAFALAFVGFNFPETLSAMLRWARGLKEMITTSGIDPKYNIWIELLLEERQLLFMMFTIGARMAIGIVSSIFLAIFAKG